MELLLPPSIALWQALALAAFSVLTSGITAAVGIGGGVLMLAAMAQVLPVPALVPVHGVVQLGSNVGRAALLAKSAAFGLLVPFALGAAVGAAIGGMVVTDLPAPVLLIAIGGFVTISPWLKVPPLGRGERSVMAGGGLVATILTMFIGATGPFVTALIRPAELSHRGLVATVAAAMTLQHTLKTLAFALIGFAFAPWAPLLALLIAAGFVGTFIGTRLHSRVPERALRRALDVVLTLVGLQLLARGVLGLF